MKKVKNVLSVTNSQGFVKQEDYLKGQYIVKIYLIIR